MIVQEKNGSLTINVKQGEVIMSTRSLGMVGKSYRTTQEAFKDATYATAIQRPTETQYSSFWSLLGALLFVIVFAYSFWLTISRF